MTTFSREDQIREAAKRLDEAVEADDITTAVDCFAEDCVISALGRTFHGKDNAAKILAWLRDSFGPIRFEHRLIIVQGDSFCEEFNFIISDRGARIPATEILIYEDAHIKELRLYVDRIDVAQIAAHNFVEKAIIDWIASMSLRDLPL